MFYWVALFLIIGIVIIIKKDSKFYLTAAFYIFCIGALLRLTGLKEVAEILMRIDFMLWIMGLIKAYREFN